MSHVSVTKSEVKQRYQTTIPKNIREMTGIQVGDELIWMYDNIRKQIIVKKKPKRFSDAMIGLGKELWQKNTGDEHIAKERESWD